MGLFRRSRDKKIDPPAPAQPRPEQDDVQDLIGSLLEQGAQFAAEHRLGSSSEEVARADSILQEALDANPSDEDKTRLHRRLTGYLYGSVIENFPNFTFITGAPDNPVAMLVGDQDNGVQVLGWSKVQGRIDNGPEDHLQFFYDGIARYLDQPGIHTLM